MARTKLHRLGNTDRHHFLAYFVCTGYKTYRSRYNPTLLLADVQLIDHPTRLQKVTDHLWFNYTKGFQQLGFLTDGDQIEFSARVSGYYKGPFNRRQYDYKLTYPTRIRRYHSNAKVLPIPQDNAALIGMIMYQNYTFYRDNSRPIEQYYLDQFDKWQTNHQQLPIKNAAHQE